jgi:NAD-dependent SIR2 family protein deacetylase
MRSDAPTILEAAEIVRTASALVVGAGAGMGVDSGLPDFRGRAGFWRAYPPFAKLGLDFEDLANPRWFFTDPGLAWGFYGHRLMLYRATVPHEGFAIVQRWAARLEHGLFVFTSNVDGQFQKAGISEARIVECHGSIHHLQCLRECHAEIWPAHGVELRVDARSVRAEPPLPKCPRCGGLARPNILMFGDGGWLPARTEAQEDRLADWRRALRGQAVAVVECGAGRAIPTVRSACEALAREGGTRLIRVNPREAEGPAGTLSIASGAVDALRAIDACLG